jgi:hypothetical protein
VKSIIVSNKRTEAFKADLKEYWSTKPSLENLRLWLQFRLSLDLLPYKAKGEELKAIRERFNEGITEWIRLANSL